MDLPFFCWAKYLYKKHSLAFSDEIQALFGFSSLLYLAPKFLKKKKINIMTEISFTQKWNFCHDLFTIMSFQIHFCLFEQKF